MQAIGGYGGEAMRSSTLVDMGGLAPSALGARVHVAGGKVTVIAGPVGETEVRQLFGPDDFDAGAIAAPAQAETRP